jgi:DeoR/GlpR family transcriptional regulator of sugar metabolism
MLEAADRVVVLADHTKFGRKAFANIANLKSGDTLVTDWHTPKPFLKNLKDRGVKVIVAGPGRKTKGGGFSGVELY